MAYSSCYCSLSALWDACADPPPPPPNPTLARYLWNGPVCEDGRWHTKISQSSHPFPLVVHPLRLRLMLYGYLDCQTLINVSLKNFFPSAHEFVVICYWHCSEFLQRLRAGHRAGICGAALWCVNILCYCLLYYLVNTIVKPMFS